MPLRLALGLGITAVMFAIAGRRFFWLYRLISAGQPAVPTRFKDVPKRIKAELVEVGGQKKLLQWTVPGWPTPSPSGASPSSSSPSSRPSAACSSATSTSPSSGTPR